MKTLEEMKEYLKKENAEYLLRFYDELSEIEKAELFKQIEHIDFELMKKLYDSRNIPPIKNKKIENIAHEILEKIPQEERKKYCERGEELLRSNKVAVCQMAGGQGTRLGYNGPKGTFEVNLKEPKTIFEIFADKLKESCEKYNVNIPWYIMTSKENND